MAGNTNKSPKKLEEYAQSKPAQLSLFELLLPEERPYSNTIELYDFIPKYHWGKVERINGRFLESLERGFECRGRRYTVRVDPARLKDKDGVVRDYYPSQREELVEDALRKLVCEGQGLFLDDEAGMTFTLYQLQQELKARGHSYSIAQLKDALFVCAQTKIIVKSEDGSAVLVSSMFDTLGLQTREGWKGTGNKTRAFVRFNPLVTQSMRSMNFRQLNYARSMAFKSVIARQLHKRISHHYTQASIFHPYQIMLSTIVRDFGLTAYEKLSNNLRDVKKALDEMVERDVLLEYKANKVMDARKGNKLADAKFTLTPHQRFTSDIMQANRRQTAIKKLPAVNTQ